jgi:hypothetical protein
MSTIFCVVQHVKKFSSRCAVMEDMAATVAAELASGARLMALARVRAALLTLPRGWLYPAE